MILSAGFIMYITRKLGSSDFGKYTLAFSLSGVLIVVAEFGIHTLLTREIAKRQDNAAMVFGNCLILKFFSVVFFFISLVLTTYLLNYSEISFIVYAMGIFVVTTSFFELLNSIFRGYEQMEYESAFMTLNRIVVVSSGVLALHIGYGLGGFVVAIVLGNLLSLFPAVFISFKKFLVPRVKMDLDLIKLILRDAYPIGLTLILSAITIKSGVVLLPLFKDYTVTGWYGAPLRFIESIIVFPLFFSTALLPVFTSLYNSRDPALTKFCERSLMISIIIGIPIATIVTLLADKVVLLLFGAGYTESVVVMQLLIWTAFFISLNTILVYFLIAVNRQRLNLLSSVVCTITTVGSSLIFIPLFSHNGAGLSLLIGQILFFVCAFYQVIFIRFPRSA